MIEIIVHFVCIIMVTCKLVETTLQAEIISSYHKLLLHSTLFYTLRVGGALVERTGSTVSL